MQLVEKVNPIVTKIQSLTFEKFSELYTSLKDRDTNADPKWIKVSFGLLKKYVSSHNNSENSITCDYSYSNERTYGRLYSSNSLQSIMSEFRGPLSNGLTYDIDMENCHVAILAFLCKSKHIECQELKNYIVKRDEYLAEIMAELKINRRTAKCMFLASMNTEDSTTLYKGKRIKSQKFLNFDTETTRIIRQLFDVCKEIHPDRVQSGVWNYKAKLINLVLQEMENNLLQKAIKFVHEKNISISTLMFDGMMIYKGDYDINELLEEMNQYFRQSGVTWSIKPHNMELFEQLSSLSEEATNCEFFVAKDINELAKHILTQKCLIRSQGTIYYEGNRIIQTCEDEIQSELYKFITEQDYYVSCDKSDIPYSSNSKNTKELISVLFLLCPISDKYISDVWTYTKGKVFFNNGYFDFKSNKFVEGVYTRTPIKIDRDYRMSTEDSDSQLFTRVLFPIFSFDPADNDSENEVRTQLLKHFLYVLKMMICGNIEIKKWMSLEGLRDSGKGVIVTLLEKAFGSYIRSTNSNNFISKKAQGDESKALSWLYSCEFVRILISQENQVGSAAYDGSLIKKLCSGGDSIEVRKNFKDERQMKMQCSLMFCCNDMPRIEPTDANETKIEVQMKTKFIEESFIGIRFNKYKYLPKDDTVKTHLIQDDEIIDAFIFAIFSADKEDYPSSLRKEIINSREDTDEEKIINLFEVTGDDRDFLSNDDIEKMLKEGSVKKTLKNAKQILVGVGAEEVSKKINKKTYRGLKGICSHGNSKACQIDEEVQTAKKA